MGRENVQQPPFADGEQNFAGVRYTVKPEVSIQDEVFVFFTRELHQFCDLLLDGL